MQAQVNAPRIAYTQTDADTRREWVGEGNAALRSKARVYTQPAQAKPAPKARYGVARILADMWAALR